MSTLLSISGISKQFNGRPILSDLSLDVNRGEVLAIVGKNGSGKSTLLKLIAGLMKPDNGRIVFRGRRMAYLPDTLPRLRFTLTEYLTAMGRIQGLTANEVNALLPQLIKDFGLAAQADARLQTYSKGMLQKAVVMQALLRQPDLLLMDEPYSGLDVIFQKDFSSIMSGLKQRGVAMLFSSHEQSLIQEIADKVLVVQYGTGRAVRTKQSLPLTEMVLQLEHEERLEPILQLADVHLIHREGSLVRLSCSLPNQNRVLHEIIAREAGRLLQLQPLAVDYISGISAQKREEA
ncbi:ABC transporter ATP-binding protein [Paenibacillus glufosinatiresistens]|uniref:ABC transporter ATP-binding protein n=1 Tax=Paenibacillus glufosinatiresistens TaxID=3070657 RepID=UPI00286E1F77|nr:ABC transporter ATP-binding protein [Paenibacillus sp. YX.27]